MRAIILAGGLGQRLGPITHCMQKCLLEIDGEAILTRAVRLVLAAGISEVTVVTGHCAPLVREELDRHFLVDRREDLGEHVTLVHNERYGSTDSAYALWLARFGVDEPMLLVDGDVVFDEAALAALLSASSKSAAIAVARARGGDRPIVHVDTHGLVSRVARDLEPTGLEAVGLAVLSRATSTHFFPALERRVITLDRSCDAYEHAFEDLFAEGRLSMRAVNVEDFRCVAVDEPEDLDRARVSFENDPGTPALQ